MLLQHQDLRTMECLSAGGSRWQVLRVSGRQAGDGFTTLAAWQEYG